MTPLVDCHVNIWRAGDVDPAKAGVWARVRERKIEIRADADSIIAQLGDTPCAIVCAISYGDTIGVASHDAVTREAARRFPDRLIPFAHVDPRKPNYLEELDRSLGDWGFRGIKLGPIYTGVSPLDPLMAPVYERARRHGVPVTMHMGTTFAGTYENRLGHPACLDEVARRHPDVRFVLAHMAHPWHEEAVTIIRRQPNLYGEISAIYYRPWQFYTVMRTIEEYRIADKVFFGSDYPFSTLGEGVTLTRAVLDINPGPGFPAVSAETVQRIVLSDPRRVWWG